MTEGKEVSTGKESETPALTSDFKEILETNFEGVNKDEIDLPRMKMLHGGALCFELPPDLDGETKQVKEIDAVILYKQRVRGWWKDDYSGGGQPPECSSSDGITGYNTEEEEVLECKHCPLSKYGSASKGRGQACKDMRRLLVRLGDDIVPSILTIPPTSVKVVDNFMVRLVSKGIKYTDIRVKLSLVSEKNKEGTPFSKLVISKSENEMTDKEKEMSKAMREYFSPAIERRAVEMDDYAPSNPPNFNLEGEEGGNADGDDDEVPF